MQHAARFWDRVAGSYAKMPIRDEDAYTATLTRVRDYMTPGCRVLELGCGTGTTAVKLADAAGEIVATDVSERMIAIGRRRAEEAGISNVTFRQNAVSEVVDGGPYDLVMAFNLLHLVNDLDAALGAMVASLRPGGTLIVKAPCLAEPGLSLKFRAILWLLPLLRMIGKAPRVYALSIDDLQDAVEAAGLEIVETGSYPEMPVNRFVVAKRPREIV